jgi:(1->4)-alpha-D-glucan 1-alpha-D-glucosylmutase
MSHVLDIVPNHVGIGPHNAAWDDVLENGPSSTFAEFFDIAWRSSPRPELHDKVLVPMLGGPYAKVLEGGELKLRIEENGAFRVGYHESSFPISPRTYPRILEHNLDGQRAELPADDPSLTELLSIISAAKRLPDRSESDESSRQERDREKEVIKRRLAALRSSSEVVRSFIDRNIAVLNGQVGKPESFDLLDDLMTHQCYRLADWHVAPDEINYRRFFDINDLAALSMHRPDVFDQAHGLVLEWIRRGELDGLRVDHPDGLRDPRGYFARLREAAGDVPVWAEKILAVDEPLPRDWAVAGTTGYEFLVHLNGLFVDPAAAETFTRVYEDFVGGRRDFDAIAYEGKKWTLSRSLASELRTLTHGLDRLAQRNRHWRDFTETALREALIELIASFGVYRTYITVERGFDETDRRRVDEAIERATRRAPHIDESIFRFIRDVLLVPPDTRITEACRRWAGRFQQVCAPTTAKGVEDTAFYRFHRLVSLNEVGGEPSHFGVDPDALHAFFADRASDWPGALSTLATHDTKRGEDVRARLNALSEFPDEWTKAVAEWAGHNAALRASEESPSRDDEFLLYQTMLGVWPMSGVVPEGERDALRDRILAYMRKAAREAKVHTSWTRQDADYETALERFTRGSFDAAVGESPFAQSFRALHRKIAAVGMVNSLAQSLVRFTAPGVADLYQGNELWDLSLVDPDNRRPVDYTQRATELERMRGAGQSGDRTAWLNDLVSHPHDGRIKLLLTWNALQARRANAELFLHGRYVPLHATGPKANHVFAFARVKDKRAAVTIVPRLVGAAANAERDLPDLAALFSDPATKLDLSPLPDGTYIDAFTGVKHSAQAVPLVDAIGRFPVSLLISSGAP